MLENKLNVLLANYETLFHKLQTYHWYVKGQSFFTDHVKLEEYYDEAFEVIDELAEKMLMVGANPLPSMAAFAEVATISEASAGLVDSQTVFAELLGDYKTLLEGATELKAAADEEDNYLISAYADELIDSLSKNVWMLTQKLA